MKFDNFSNACEISILFVIEKNRVYYVENCIGEKGEVLAVK